MKEKYMRQINMRTIGELKTLEKHFTDMLEQGWMVDKFGGVIIRYRAVEPCKKQFYVDLLPQITAFDYPDNELAHGYRRLCQDSGWEFVTASKQIHVFCADEDAAPIPIHTDNKIQAQIYLKACRKQELFSYIMFLFMFGLNIFQQLFFNGIEIFLNDTTMIVFFAFLFISICYLWTLGYIILWYIRARRSAKLNLPLPEINYRLARARRIVFVTGTVAGAILATAGLALLFFVGIWVLQFFLIFFVPMPLAMAVIMLVKRQIDTKPRTRKANRRRYIIASVAVIVIMFISMNLVMRYMFGSIGSSDMFDRNLGDRPVITMRDIGIYHEPHRTGAIVNGSMAVPVNYTYWESSKYGGGLNMEVHRPVSILLSRGLYNRFVNRIDRHGIWSENWTITNLRPDEAIFWGADEGIALINNYTGLTNRLIMLCGKTILNISFYDEGTDMNMAAQAVGRLWEFYEN